MSPSIGFGLLAPLSPNPSKSEKERRVSWSGRLSTTWTISNPSSAESTTYSEPDRRNELRYADLRELDQSHTRRTQPPRESTTSKAQSTALPDKASTPVDGEGTSGIEVSRTISRESDTQSTPGSLMGRDECWADLMVLSLDGGGIRGLSALFILKELMSQIELLERADGRTNRSASFTSKEESNSRWSSDSEHFLPCHYFDMICGTSTGGLIAVMLGRLRFTVEQTIENFSSIWQSMALQPRHNRITNKPSKLANSKGLSDALENIVQRRARGLSSPGRALTGSIGDAMFASDSRLCRTLVVATEVDSRQKNERRPYLFRSYQHNNIPFRETDCDTHSIRIEEVCLAISATPRYFKSARIQGLESKKFRDGAIWSPNPTMEVYREICSLYSSESKKPIGCLVSIGCGENKRQNAGHSLSTLRFKIGSSLVAKEQQEIERTIHFKGDSGEFQYHRFSDLPSLPGIEEGFWLVDTIGKTTFKKIQDATHDYCKDKEVKEKIKLCATTLVDRRRKRAQTKDWEVFAGIRYTCLACKPESPPPFEDRDHFMDHLQHTHHAPPPDEQFYEEVHRIVREWSILSVQ